MLVWGTLLPVARIISLLLTESRLILPARRHRTGYKKPSYREGVEQSGLRGGGGGEQAEEEESSGRSRESGMLRRRAEPSR